MGLIFGKHDYRALLRKAAVAAGIDSNRSSRITPNDFRHSRLTDLGQTSANLPGLMFLAGHTQPSTMARYMKPQRLEAQEVLQAAAAAPPRNGNREFLFPIGSRETTSGPTVSKGVSPAHPEKSEIAKEYRCAVGESRTPTILLSPEPESCGLVISA